MLQIIPHTQCKITDLNFCCSYLGLFIVAVSGSYIQPLLWVKIAHSAEVREWPWLLGQSVSSSEFYFHFLQGLGAHCILSNWATEPLVPETLARAAAWFRLWDSDSLCFLTAANLNQPLLLPPQLWKLKGRLSFVRTSHEACWPQLSPSLQARRQLRGGLSLWSPKGFPATADGVTRGSSSWVLQPWRTPPPRQLSYGDSGWRPGGPTPTSPSQKDRLAPSAASSGRLYQMARRTNCGPHGHHGRRPSREPSIPRRLDRTSDRHLYCLYCLLFFVYYMLVVCILCIFCCCFVLFLFVWFFSVAVVSQVLAKPLIRWGVV